VLQNDELHKLQLASNIMIKSGSVRLADCVVRKKKWVGETWKRNAYRVRRESQKVRDH
jgi:hypothetical protein